MVAVIFLLSLKISYMVYFSLVGDRLEGAEAGSRQAAVDAAVQSAAAHLTMQLGPALFYTLLHGSANKDKHAYLYLQVWTREFACVQMSQYIFVCVLIGDGSADLRALEEDPRWIFSH